MSNEKTKIDLRAKAPLAKTRVDQLRRDVRDLFAAAKRKCVTLDAWEERDERRAAESHFELGCWLHHYTTLRNLSPEESLQARVNVLVRLFMADIQNPGYRFFTAFDFGERQFDGMFEQGDAKELINALREHSALDNSGLMAKAFEYYGWPKESPCHVDAGMDSKYVIYSPNEAAVADGDGFWSNENGWTSFDGATAFSLSEMNALNLPDSTGQDARWVLWGEAQAHCAESELGRSGIDTLSPAIDHLTQRG